MGTTDRRQRHRASLKRKILDAASQLFIEEGYHHLTMRRLAERIEYSPTTIYLYFKDKHELLSAVCEETFEQLAGKLERLREQSGPPLASLREGLRAYVDFGLAHPSQYIVTFVGTANGPAGLDGGSFGHAIGGRAFETLRQSVRACVEHGDIQTPDLEMTARAVWAGVHGVTSLLIRTKGIPSADRQALVDHLIETLVVGLRNPAATLRSPVGPRSKKWDFFD